MGSFRRIALGDRAEISRYLRMFPQNEASEYTFTNLFIWGGSEDIQWMEKDSFLLIRATVMGALRYLMAFAQPENLENALESAIGMANGAGEAFAMHSLPPWYCDMMEKCMPGRFLFEREPHMDDYIYNTMDLTDLAGKKYHGKRNHINKFMSMYAGRYEYVPYSPELADGCMDVYNRWYEQQEESEALNWERDSVNLALYNSRELEVIGGVILIAGKPRAFSIGEMLTSDMAVIHIEKASPEIPELFSVINRTFAANGLSGSSWINREEDMGNEGLRRAKRSYRPVRMVEKYRAGLKG